MSLYTIPSGGGPLAKTLVDLDGSRTRTTSNSSTITSAAAGCVSSPTTYSLANFYLSLLRRRPAILIAALAFCLLALIATEKYASIEIPFSARINETANVILSAEPPQPLTELGFEADLVYENIGSTDSEEYRTELESFIKQKFLTSDGDAGNPDSLMGTLHKFLRPPPTVPSVHPQKALQHLTFMPWLWTFNKIKRLWSKPPPTPPPKAQPVIPEKIFQTGPYPGEFPPPDKLLPIYWKKSNPDYQYKYYDNAAALQYIEQRFNESYVNGGKGGGIAQIYREMKDVPVMQSDFWRYTILATEGGVYSDIDTKCLKPIQTWHRLPWHRTLSIFDDEPRPKPAIIVAIEVDVGSRPDWHAWWPRPLGIVQWTIASTKGHPILIDTMRRVAEAVEHANSTSGLKEGQHRNLDAVVEKTGPGPFTDSVLRYLGAQYNVTWPALRNLPNEGILFGSENLPADVLVLSVTAFSPGVGQFGAGDAKNEAALVQHYFAGTWKSGG